MFDLDKFKITFEERENDALAEYYSNDIFQHAIFCDTVAEEADTKFKKWTKENSLFIKELGARYSSYLDVVDSVCDCLEMLHYRFGMFLCINNIPVQKMQIIPDSELMSIREFQESYKKMMKLEIGIFNAPDMDVFKYRQYKKLLGNKEVALLIALGYLGYYQYETETNLIARYQDIYNNLI